MTSSKSLDGRIVVSGSGPVARAEDVAVVAEAGSGVAGAVGVRRVTDTLKSVGPTPSGPAIEHTVDRGGLRVPVGPLVITAAASSILERAYGPGWATTAMPRLVAALRAAGHPPVLVDLPG